MDIEFEVLVVFLPAMLFSIFYFIRRSPVSAALSSVCWFTTAVAFMIGQPTMYGLCYLFYGFGAVFLVFAIAETVMLLGESREEVWEL